MVVWGALILIIFIAVLVAWAKDRSKLSPAARARQQNIPRIGVRFSGVLCFVAGIFFVATAVGSQNWRQGTPFGVIGLAFIALGCKNWRRKARGQADANWRRPGAPPPIG